MLCYASGFITHQNAYLFDLVAELSELRSRILTSQSDVIKLQEDLLSCQAQKLESVQSTVTSTVQEVVHNTVQTEIKSYSEAVAGTISQSHSDQITSEKLKKTLQDVVEENDRSKNLMVFGFTEEEEEDLVGRLEEIFDELGEKPHIEACRVGTKASGKSRPVKISMSNSVKCQQILAKSWRLKRTVKYKTVYFAPDRSVIQREEHKKLVEELKKVRLAANDPEKRYFIKNGKIESIDKNLN